MRFLNAEAREPRSAPVDPQRPFALADARDAASIFATNRAAEAEGVTAGMRLADARARIGFLQVRRHDPAADAEALARLALWATRYTPSVAPFDAEAGSDGLFLDITGAAHLLGGEEQLLADLARRLATFGLEARLAGAETPGTAWAMAHFARTRRTIVAAGQETEALSSLPVEALRLDEETVRTLRRLGLKHIGALMERHRAPFAARFERRLLRRLDQSLARAPEPLRLLAPPPVYIARRSLLEPVFTADAVVALTHTLMREIATDLEREGAGARMMRLSLYRVDGHVTEMDLALARPTRSPDHVARLLRLRLERIANAVEAGYGFETFVLAVTVTNPMAATQEEMAGDPHGSQTEARLVGLIDALRHRLGPESVRRLEAHARHIPEKSEAAIPAAPDAPQWPAPHRPRPLLMLPRPEPAAVIAAMPDGPPQRLRWRGELHVITHAEGPERIAAEWWQTFSGAPTRDYYLAEEESGRRLWLYREGLPGRETASPRWFVHGFFA